MQNKAKLPNAQMNVTSLITMDYVNIGLRSRFKNKAKQSQTESNCNRYGRENHTGKHTVFSRTTADFGEDFCWPVDTFAPHGTGPWAKQNYGRVQNLFYTPYS